MPGNSVIGALRVVLGADTASFEDGMKNAESGLAGFAKRAAEIASGIELQKMFESLAEGIKEAIFGTIDGIDKLGKESQKIGIPIDQLSALRVAAATSDLSMESMGQAVAKLAKNMVDAAGNSTSLAARAFTALGISVKDSGGELRSSNDVMTAIAQKFAGMQDGAGKTALAIALFGRAGADMIPMLNQGAAGLENFKAEAEKLGLTLSEEDFKAANEFNDALTKLSLAKQGVVTIVTARMLPAMNLLASTFVGLVKDTDSVRNSADGLSRAIIFLVDNFSLLVKLTPGLSLLTKLGEGFDVVKNAIANVLPEGTGATIVAGLDKIGVNTRALTADTTTLAASLKSLGGASHDAGENLAKVKPPTIMSEEQAQQIKRLNDQIDQTALKARLIKGDFDNLAPGFVAAADGLKMFGTRGIEAGTTVDQLSPKLQQLNFNMAMIAALQFTNPSNQFVQMNQAIVALNASMASGSLTAAQYAQASGAAASLNSQYWQVSAASVAGSMEETANAFAGNSSRIAALAKIFGAVQALISTYTGAAKALELPFPANIAAVAAVTAKGLSLVAAIKGAAVPKMATGGSFTVPGGIGGSDRVQVPIMAFPGERVSIERPQPGGMASGSGNIVSLALNGKMFDRDTVREMLGQVQQLVADGYKLKLA